MTDETNEQDGWDEAKKAYAATGDLVIATRTLRAALADAKREIFELQKEIARLRYETSHPLTNDDAKSLVAIGAFFAGIIVLCAALIIFG